MGPEDVASDLRSSLLGRDSGSSAMIEDRGLGLAWEEASWSIQRLGKRGHLSWTYYSK